MLDSLANTFTNFETEKLPRTTSISSKIHCKVWSGTTRTGTLKQLRALSSERKSCLRSAASKSFKITKAKAKTFSSWLIFYSQNTLHCGWNNSRPSLNNVVGDWQGQRRGTNSWRVHRRVQQENWDSEAAGQCCSLFISCKGWFLVFYLLERMIVRLSNK